MMRCVVRLRSISPPPPTTTSPPSSLLPRVWEWERCRLARELSRVSGRVMLRLLPAREGTFGVIPPPRLDLRVPDEEEELYGSRRGPAPRPSRRRRRRWVERDVDAVVVVVVVVVDVKVPVVVVEEENRGPRVRRLEVVRERFCSRLGEKKSELTVVEKEKGAGDGLGHEGGVEEVDGVDVSVGCLGGLGGADDDENAGAVWEGALV